ncbi:unnamed protein product [Rotaria sp. Silwood2]|nr:unnamed protein product [Rotaria sp. Silwood2]CAF4284545.1 unnamed protein product [Rotaria sp. Silwood2]CAF4295813.1 unnamed protein product [Rotaria sp. Silwood2]
MDVFEIFSSVFMLLCSILGVVCAFIFIGIVICSRQCRTITILLVLNSTAANLIINFACGSQAFYQLASDGNDRLCELRGFFIHLGTSLLYHTLCVQALHRLFVTVLARQRYLQSTRVIIFLVILQWLMSLGLCLPMLLTGHIVYHPKSRICQVAMSDLFVLLGLAVFVYLCPLIWIGIVYIQIVRYAKYNISITIRRCLVQKQQREVRLIRRILTLFGILLIMGFPYFVFFLMVQFTQSPAPSYGLRLSFVFLSFGYGICSLLNLLYTDDVRKNILNRINICRCHNRQARVQCVNTINVAN